MKIQCDCGAFKADLTAFPKNTPGRLACYCKDCQTFLHRLGRAELLDAYGGSEIIPVYPSEFTIISGEDKLRCNRLTQDGLYRWSTTCCNSPVANTKPNFPWIGILHSAYTASDPDSLTGLGPIRSRIFGRDATGDPPFKISQKLDLKAALAVLPFLLKGKLFGKSRNHPFFGPDGKTPIKEPEHL